MIIIGAGLGLVVFAQLAGHSELAVLQTLLTVLLGALMAATIAVYTVDYVNEVNERRKWRREDTKLYFEPVYEEMPTIISNLKTFQPVLPQQWEKIAHSGSGVMVDQVLVGRLRQFRGRLETHVNGYAVLVKEFDTQVLELLQYALPGVRDLQVSNVSRPILEALPGILGKGKDWRVPAPLERRFESMYDVESKRGALTGRMEPSGRVLRLMVERIQNNLTFDAYEQESKWLLQEAEKLSESLRSALREASGVP